MSGLDLRTYCAQFAGPHVVVVESTGFWYWLADLLDDLGVDLTVAHATRLKAIAAAKVKTDKLDSDLLAQPLRAGLITASVFALTSIPTSVVFRIGASGPKLDVRSPDPAPSSTHLVDAGFTASDTLRPRRRGRGATLIHKLDWLQAAAASPERRERLTLNASTAFR